MNILYLNDQTKAFKIAVREIVFVGPLIIDETIAKTDDSIISKLELMEIIETLSVDNVKGKVDESKYPAFDGDLINAKGTNNFTLSTEQTKVSEGKTDFTLDEKGRVLNSDTNLKLVNDNIDYIPYPKLTFNELEKTYKGGYVIDDFTFELVKANYLILNAHNTIRYNLILPKENMEGDYIISYDNIISYLDFKDLNFSLKDVKKNNLSGLDVDNRDYRDFYNYSSEPYRNLSNLHPGGPFPSAYTVTDFSDLVSQEFHWSGLIVAGNKIGTLTRFNDGSGKKLYFEGFNLNPDGSFSKDNYFFIPVVWSGYKPEESELRGNYNVLMFEGLIQFAKYQSFGNLIINGYSNSLIGIYFEYSDTGVFNPNAYIRPPIGWGEYLMTCAWGDTLLPFFSSVVHKRIIKPWSEIKKYSENPYTWIGSSNIIYSKLVGFSPRYAYSPDKFNQYAIQNNIMIKLGRNIFIISTSEDGRKLYFMSTKVSNSKEPFMEWNYGVKTTNLNKVYDSITYISVSGRIVLFLMNSINGDICIKEFQISDIGEIRFDTERTVTEFNFPITSYNKPIGEVFIKSAVMTKDYVHLLIQGKILSFKYPGGKNDYYEESMYSKSNLI